MKLEYIFGLLGYPLEYNIIVGNSQKYIQVPLTCDTLISYLSIWFILFFNYFLKPTYLVLEQ
jgi:hypothetical protein